METYKGWLILIVAVATGSLTWWAAQQWADARSDPDTPPTIGFEAPPGFVGEEVYVYDVHPLREGGAILLSADGRVWSYRDGVVEQVRVRDEALSPLPPVPQSTSPDP